MYNDPRYYLNEEDKFDLEGPPPNPYKVIAENNKPRHNSESFQPINSDRTTAENTKRKTTHSSKEASEVEKRQQSSKKKSEKSKK